MKSRYNQAVQAITDKIKFKRSKQANRSEKGKQYRKIMGVKKIPKCIVHKRQEKPWVQEDGGQGESLKLPTLTIIKPYLSTEKPEST